jgi:hypothetical protein
MFKFSKLLMLKKRKIESHTTKTKCNICLEEKKHVNSCFHKCSIKTCTNCIIPQLKVKRIPGTYWTQRSDIHAITYKCSQCQQEVRYFPRNTNDTKGLVTEMDKRFSTTCINDLKIMESITNKFINTKNSTNENENEEENEYEEESEYWEEIPHEAMNLPPRFSQLIRPPSPGELPYPNMVITTTNVNNPGNYRRTITFSPVNVPTLPPSVPPNLEQVFSDEDSETILELLDF